MRTALVLTAVLVWAFGIAAILSFILPGDDYRVVRLTLCPLLGAPMGVWAAYQLMTRP